ncbi:MAG: hypothetical protein GY940_13795 [bacterium]|nr:hypothetical protein [bacterium]
MSLLLGRRVRGTANQYFQPGDIIIQEEDIVQSITIHIMNNEIGSTIFKLRYLHTSKAKIPLPIFFAGPGGE